MVRHHTKERQGASCQGTRQTHEEIIIEVHLPDPGTLGEATWSWDISKFMISNYEKNKRIVFFLSHKVWGCLFQSS